MIIKDIILETDKISYSYDTDKMALDSISLQIHKGDKLAVLGSNGAGKSTCFLTLNGVLQPDEGKILYHGKEMTGKNLNELRKNVGIVFQEADSQIIASTVFQEISFGPMNLRLSKEEVKRRVLEAMESMSLTDLKDRPPHYLSGGEKKRVTIADILAMEPEIIIFDEPTASLDPVNVEMFKGVLDKMAELGKTLLISTHDVDFAFQWAERALVFSHGKVIGEGPVEEIFQNEELLREADLRKPIILEVYESLVKYGIVEKGTCLPRDHRGIDELLGGR